MSHSFDMLTFDFLLKPPQPVTGLFFKFTFNHLKVSFPPLPQKLLMENFYIAETSLYTRMLPSRLYIV